jgi:membrane-anchored protein YejM (alkaline phosphatase superfamily)
MAGDTLGEHRQMRDRLLRWWGALLLTTVAFLLLVSCRYFSVVDLDAQPASLIFRGAMLLAHFTTLATLCLLPLLLLLFLWPRPRVVIPLGCLIGAAVVTAVLIDTQVYQLYRFHINAGVLNLLFGGAVRETFFFSKQMYGQAALIAVAILGAFAIGAGWAWRRSEHTQHGRVVPRATVAMLSVAVVIFHSTHIWADAVGYEPFLAQTEVLPMRYAATAKRLLRAHGVKLREMPLRQADQNAAGGGLLYPLRPLTCHAPDEPPNIVVILIDSWRFDELDAEVTPNIATFAQRSARFMDHYSGGNATRIGTFSLFYSIPGTYWHRVLAERRGPVLIEQVSKLGYEVQAFRSAPLYSPEFDRTVFARIERIRTRSDGQTPAARDRDLTNDFLEYLSSRADASPFFALLFYDAPHSFDYPSDYPTVFGPVDAAVNYLELHRGTDPRPLLNRYRNSLHYVDSLVGEVFAALASRGLMEDSVVIVTSDHGQEFNDNSQNYWGHNSNFTRFQTGVPLLLYAPDIAPAVHWHRTSHFDVMPTIMRDYLGCTDALSTYSVGRSLFEHGGRDIILLSEYADFAIMHADQIAIVREHGMELRDARHVKLDARLDPKVIAEALEQKTRFATGRPVETGAGQP